MLFAHFWLHAIAELSQCRSLGTKYQATSSRNGTFNPADTEFFNNLGMTIEHNAMIMQWVILSLDVIHGYRWVACCLAQFPLIWSFHSFDSIIVPLNRELMRVIVKLHKVMFDKANHENGFIYHHLVPQIPPELPPPKGLVEVTDCMISPHNGLRVIISLPFQLGLNHRHCHTYLPNRPPGWSLHDACAVRQVGQSLIRRVQDPHQGVGPCCGYCIFR